MIYQEQEHILGTLLILIEDFDNITEISKAVPRQRMVDSGNLWLLLNYLIDTLDLVLNGIGSIDPQKKEEENGQAPVLE